jgi:predicted nucleotidyltransferase
MVSNREEIISLLRSNQETLSEYGVRSLALFGSAARDNLHAGSDLDILVQFEQSTWANYIGLKLYLENLLGRPVDLVTPKALRPLLRPSIERDLLHVVTQS